MELAYSSFVGLHDFCTLGERDGTTQYISWIKWEYYWNNRQWHQLDSDGDGEGDACDFTPFSIEEENIQISIYPNPATEFISIQSNTFMQKISLFDYAGKLVIEKNENSKDLSVNTSNLEKGNYIILIETENKQLKDQIVIQ